MKRIFVFLLLALFVMVSAPLYAAEVVNADKYIEIVRENNHSVLAALRGVESAYYQVLASVAPQRMKSSFSVSGYYFTSQGIFDNPVGYTMAPSITQMIDISGINKLDERVSILNYESARAGFDNTLNNILTSAEQAYWNVVLARENLSLQTDVLRQRQENLRVTEEKFNQQLVPKLDVIRATTQVSDAENKIVDAQGKLSNTLASLRNFAGGRDVEPESTIFYVPVLSLESDPTQVVALEKHPSVRQRRLQLAQAEFVKKRTEKNLSPTLGLSVAWDMLTGTSVGESLETGDASARLSLNIPISDGNQTKYSTIDKSIAIETARQTLFAAEADVILNLSLALNNWNTAKSLEENMKKQVERSNEELKITELMYNEGMGSQLDLITAQTDNQLVRTNYLQAVLGMYTSITDLRKSLGDYATNEDGSWKTAVLKYGKEAPKSLKAPAKPEEPKREYWDKIQVSVGGVNMNLEQAQKWLRDGALSDGAKKDKPNEIPLYKKNPNTQKNEVYVPYTERKNITLEEAEEWLRKNK